MLMKVAVVFFVFALVAAVAGSIPAAGPVYRVTLTEPASVNGTALKAGEYKVAVNAGKAIFVLGKESHEVAVKVEEAAKKFDGNRIQFDNQNNANAIKEICIGGTRTKLIFN
jgi:hypothetical protein